MQKSSISDRQQRQLEKLKHGELVAGVWTIVTLLLSVGLFAVGTYSGITAMVADALHNIGDFGAMLSAWFALRISQKKPSEKFKYGYYKTENLATLFISVFIVYEAIQLLFQGYSALLELPEITDPLPALFAALISVAVHYFMMRHLFKVGGDINSQSMIVNAQERRVCIFSSSIVFLTVLLVWFKVPYVEGLVTFLISIFVLRIGVYAARDAIYVLLDVSPDESIAKKIIGFAKETPEIAGFEGLKLRRSGPFIFGEISIQIKEGRVERAHEIAHALESKILSSIQQVHTFTVQIEPYETREKKVVLPINEDKGLDSEIVDKFGRAKLFIFVTLDGAEGRINNVAVEVNQFREKKIKAGLAAANELIRKGANVLIGRELGEISFHTLRDHQVNLLVAEGKTVREAVNKFINNELRRMDDHASS